MKIARKLLLSILAAFVLLVCLSTTTFAWFNVYSSAEVEGFNINVISGQGFLVSIDNEHFYNDLSKEQMLDAILLSYGEDENPSQPSYQLRNEVLYYSTSDAIVTAQEKEQLVATMKIKPRTSIDGISLMDLDNFEDLRNGGTYDGSYESVHQSDGSFIRFNVYFRTTNRDTTSNYGYNIYLHGEDYTALSDAEFNERFSNYTIQERNFIRGILPTRITSHEVNVTLIAPLTASDQHVYGPDEPVGYKTIKVYPSNAMRFSIYDETKFEENVVHSAPIYELTNSGNWGSYATDYKAEEDTDVNHTSEDKALLTRLYDSRYNAGFNYYNDLKGINNGLTALEYNNMPKTYKDLINEDIPTVTTLKDGEDAKKITFTFWLEGWDAECFDGIANDISVYMAFRSERVIINNN